LRLINVKVESSNNESFQISKSTLEELSAACSEPPHLILADYGYAKPEIISTLRKFSEQGKEITEQDLIGKVFNTSDLAFAAKEYSIDNKNDSYKRKSISKNFLELKAKLYLYSYTSKDFYKALGEISSRVNRTQSVFSNCKVMPIDTKYEFYNGAEFDWPNEQSKHDGKFYAHLVSGLLNNLIQIEFLEFILNDAKRLRYFRVQKSVITVGAIVALGGAIGAVGEWLGGRVFYLFNKGMFENALTLVVLAIVFTLVIGLIIPVSFEKVMSGLLSKSNSNDES
jgi:hypothetical protein